MKRLTVESGAANFSQAEEEVTQMDHDLFREIKNLMKNLMGGRDLFYLDPFYNRTSTGFPAKSRDKVGTGRPKK